MESVTEQVGDGSSPRTWGTRECHDAHDRQYRFIPTHVGNAPLTIGGDYVSSSRVRTLIQQGDVRAAGELLTQPYRMRGMVTHGAGRGAKIGFPTANVAAIDTLLPAQGVYAGRAITAAGTGCMSALSAERHLQAHH